MTERPKIKLWMLILLGPLMIALGIHTYSKLADFEATGGRITLNKLDKLFYDLGGKTTVLLVWCGLGAFYLFAVYRFFKLDRENRARIAAAEDRITTRAEQIAAAERKLAQPPAGPPAEPPRPAPPRIGEDPFREPPAKPPILVNKAEIAAAPVPRASAPALSSETADKPKFLK